MSPTDLVQEAKHLSVAQRLDLIDELIDSVESDTAETISTDLRAELDRRYQAFVTNPDEGEPWEVVRERIRRSLNAAANNRSA